MASNASRGTHATKRPLAAAAVAAGLCSLVLISMPVAAGEAKGTRRAPQAERRIQPATTTPASSPAAPAVKSAGPHPRRGGHGAPAHAPAAPGQPGKAAAPAVHAHPSRQASRPAASRPRASGRSPGGAGTAPADVGSAHRAPAPGGSRRPGAPGKDKHRPGRAKPPRHLREAAGKETETAPPAPQPVAAVAAPAATAPAARPSSPAEPLATAVPVAAARRRAAARTATAAPTRALPAEPAATPDAARPKPRTGTSRDQAARPHGEAAPAPAAAIVRTITRLVGIVPSAVRLLIAALVAAALALALRSWTAGRRARRLMRQRGQLLEDVGLLQAALLPVPAGRLGPVSTSVAYRPADGPAAGGDFYDVFALESGEVAVIIGDLSGHGREALPHTALVRFTVRAYLEAGLSPRAALRTAGRVLDTQLGGSFATVLAATYNPRRRTLTYASAGHPPPVVVGAAVEGAEALRTITRASAPPIGGGSRTGTRQTVISVPGPATLCFHTDGITEARIDGGELFGPERLASLLAALDPGAAASVLLDGVAAETEQRPDDMATCVLRVGDGAGLPGIAAEEIELDRESAGSDRTARFLAACGLAPAAAEAAMQTARAQAEGSGRVLMQVRFSDGLPHISLQHDNVVHTLELASASAS